MKLRQYLFASIGAIAIMSTTLPGSFGQDQNQARLSVAVVGGGPLGSSISFLPSDNDDITSGSMVITVLDTRGLASGWCVVLDTRGGFYSDASIGVDSPGLISRVIAVRQGNSELSGHTIFEAGAKSEGDSVRWSTARHFGDGEYDLTLTGTVPRSAAEAIGTHTVTLTMCGSAP